MHSELALDQSGSADIKTFHRSVGFAAVISLLAIGIAVFGYIQLPVLPQFATFHACFVMMADAITSFMLLGQFRYRRQVSYAILGCAYLLNALLMIPFLLSFPEALRATGGVIGGAQSSVWIWHIWRIVFPLLALLSMVVDVAAPATPARPERVTLLIWQAVGVALGISLIATLAISTFHDFLPVLLSNAQPPLTSLFYVLNSLAAVITVVALLLAWRRGWRHRTILHLWLAVALTASLAEILGSLASSGRYTLGWYGGRVESMIAGSVLLLVFIGKINVLYQRLADAMRDLSATNWRLTATVEDKECLLADLRRSEEEVRQLAFYDTLTELPNRRLLLDRMSQAASQANRHRHAMAVLYLDLDHFKEINDSLGHEVGDELLRIVAARLVVHVRAGDTVSRLGGDEFVIVLAEITQANDAAQVAEKIVQSLGEPVDIGEHHFHVSASVGIAVFPAEGSADMRERMRRADAAMYAAKDAGGNTYRFYADRPTTPAHQAPGT